MSDKESTIESNENRNSNDSELLNSSEFEDIVKNVVDSLFNTSDSDENTDLQSSILELSKSIIESKDSSSQVEEQTMSNPEEIDVEEKAKEEKRKTIKTLKDFYKIIQEFGRDLLTSFPEYKYIIEKWWDFDENLSTKEKLIQSQIVFNHCVDIFPERFLDILNKKEEIFDIQSTVNTEFLPNIIFKHIWNFQISANTKEVIWKYLQLILIAVVNTMEDKAKFGDSAKLFENINETELKNKLEETVQNIQNMFSKAKSSDTDNNSTSLPSSASSSSTSNIPNMNDLNGHIHGMMDGKLGKLAFEMAEETASNLDIDVNNMSSTNDVFQSLFKNPGKLMNMVKTMGSKLDSKIKSGEIDENEILTEGMELIGKMKDMPGMNDIQGMFDKMGMGDIANLGKFKKNAKALAKSNGLGGGGGGSVTNNINANDLFGNLNNNFQKSMKADKLRTKLEKQKAAAAALAASTSSTQSSNQTNQTNQQDKPLLTDEELIQLFESNKIPYNKSKNK
jgi:hypothetical protein